ncbi:MAG: V-type ATPase subunit, partial [Candidatus Hodarchaeota archaeon]
MQLGRVNEYSFLNAKIRALKSKILTYDVIENLLSADSMIEIGRQIGDQFPTATEFLKGSITDPIQIEDALRTDFNSSIQKVVKYAPKATQPFLFHYLRRDFYLYMKHIVRQLDAQESTHE